MRLGFVGVSPIVSWETVHALRLCGRPPIASWETVHVLRNIVGVVLLIVAGTPKPRTLYILLRHGKRYMRLGFVGVEANS